MEVGFLQETKSILKSLVLSSPNGMTIDKLNRDYREVIGSWIPHQKLGFVNLELFLKSIPDTLTVTGHGREAKVGFVSNEKLQHINEMVSRQKNTTRERKAAVLHSSAKPPAHSFHRPSNKVNTVRTPTYCTYSSISSNNSVFYVCPSNYYPSIIPQPVPINANYLIERQPLVCIPYQNVQKPNLLATHNVQYKKKMQPEFSNKKTVSNILPEKNCNTLLNEHTLENALGKRINSKIVLPEPNVSKRILSEPNHSKHLLNVKESIHSKSTLNKQERSQTMTEIDKGSKKILNKANENEYLHTEQQITEPSSSLYDTGNSMQILDSQKAEGFLDQQKHSKTVESSNNSKNILNGYDSKQALDRKPPMSKNALEILRYPNHKKKMPVVKQKEILKRGNPIKEASGQLELSITQSKNASLTENNNTTIQADPFSNIDPSDNDIDEAVPEFAANDLVFRVDFPENMVAFGKLIPSYELPKDIAKGSVVGVFISEIHSPFKFWFHLYKDNHELDILMNRIECFYRRLHKKDLVIPKSCLAPGQVCAALYNDLWHRAEVLTKVHNNKIKVHFVDYGTVSEIEIQNIKYLPTIFANTPMQALRGSLSHIKPISPIWPKRAIREFLSMVSEVLLYAQIIEVDEREKTTYMVLCDTNNGQTVQINKQLVDKGYANLDSEWDENKITKNGYRKRHPRDIFPTFEMLETGEYPSLYELERLLAQGIDYEQITEKIILHNLNDELLLRDDCSERKSTLSFNLLDTNPFKGDIISEIVSLKIFGD